MRNIGHDGLYMKGRAAYVSAGTGLRSRLAFTGKLPPGCDAQLGEDVGEVRLGRAGRDEQALSDLGVGQPLGGQEGDIAFGLREACPAGCSSPARTSALGGLRHGL